MYSIKKESATLTWVYYMGTGLGIATLLLIVLIIWKVRRQQKLSREIKIQRGEGAPTWGDQTEPRGK